MPEDVDPFGFDLALYDRMMLLGGLYFRWLRVRVDGWEHVPADGAALLVGNSYPTGHDTLALQYALREHHPAHRVVRPLVSPHIGRWRGYGHVATRCCGSVIGHPRNADYLLGRGELTLVYPEGVNSPARSRDWSQLLPPRKWGRGFVRTALSNDVPIIPFA